MSERKVLNKYYPPEFDPSKIPKLKQGKNRTFSIRIMAPFNMRCHTCGEYIYKGKKFNSRKENVDDEDYLGLRIFRFYIKCPRCVAEIAFKTDLANTDYALEAGATRLFEAEKLAHQMAERERKEKEEDELNPMKMLENRTKASRNEMDQLDQLEELREINARHAKVEHAKMLEQHMAYEEQLLKLQEEEEDKLVQAILNQGKPSGGTIRRIEDTDAASESHSAAKKARQETLNTDSATDILAESGSSKEEVKVSKPWEKSVGSFSKKTSLAGLVRKKTPKSTTQASSSATTTTTSGPSATATSTSSSSTGTGTEEKKATSHPTVTSGSEATSTGSGTTSSPSTSNGPSTSALASGSKESEKDDQPSSSLGALGMLGSYSDSESDGSD